MQQVWLTRVMMRNKDLKAYISIFTPLEILNRLPVHATIHFTSHICNSFSFRSRRVGEKCVGPHGFSWTKKLRNFFLHAPLSNSHRKNRASPPTLYSVLLKASMGWSQQGQQQIKSMERSCCRLRESWPRRVQRTQQVYKVNKLLLLVVLVLKNAKMVQWYTWQIFSP